MQIHRRELLHLPVEGRGSRTEDVRLHILYFLFELHGNEKYYYLSKGLPTASSNPGTIRTGDLMLYGSTCVVLFYETFSTSYTYTRLGRITNPSGLASALGSGGVNVTFEITD